MPGARSFPGSPYDGHVLSAQLEQTGNLLQDLGRSRKLSSQLSHESVESSGLFGGFGHLELRRVWVEGDGGYEAPIAGLS